jgi:hypothetical protein
MVLKYISNTGNRIYGPPYTEAALIGSILRRVSKGQA